MNPITLLLRGARLLSGEATTASLNRRCWRGEHRAWIEVRGLADADGTELGQRVADTLRAQPGVVSVRINRQLSRVVIGLTDDTSLKDLCGLIDDTERLHRRGGGSAPVSLPGDGLLLLARGVMVGANAAGLAVAVAGWALRLPQAPMAVDAVATFANYQPWLRRGWPTRSAPGRPTPCCP